MVGVTKGNSWRIIGVSFSRDNLIVLGIMAVIATTYFTVVHRIQSASARTVSDRTLEVKRLMETELAQANRVPSMIREIEQMKRRYNEQEWGRRLPERQELSGFLRDIASGLSQEKLSNQFIQPGNPYQTPRYNCLPITLRFEGDFLSLARFLKRIDGMARLTRIEHMAISSGQAGEKLEIEMGMNIYFTEQQSKAERAGIEQ